MCRWAPLWWMGGPIWGHGWLGILIFLAAAAGLVYLLVRVFRSRRDDDEARFGQDRYDSIGILKMRLARGEIDQEEYARLRSLLEGH